MAVSLTSILGALADLASWRNQLQPASFRGVPFYVDTMGGADGRRSAVFEFPNRDDAYVEDLGRRVQKINLDAYVIGDDYIADRDDLIDALGKEPGPGTLVHPTRGSLWVQAGEVSFQETKEAGGLCKFRLEFVIAGPPPGPYDQNNTAAGLFAAAVSAARMVMAVYKNVSLLINAPLFVLGQQGGLLGLVAGAISAFSSGGIAGLGPSIAAIAADPASDDATTAAIVAVTDGIAAHAIAAATPPDASGDPVAGTLPWQFPADPSAGLAALAAVGADWLAPAGNTPAALAQQAQLAAMRAFVQGSALLSLLQAYAQIDWPYAQAADAAHAQVSALIDVQIEDAANRGQDDLYRTWMAVAAAADADMTGRARNLPNLVPYNLPFSLPADVLAMQFYGDSTRADELIALNGVPLSLFMPASGVRLSV